MTDYKNLKLIATSNPHIRGSETTRTIMLDVIIAMCPALIWAIIYFGVEALLLTAVSVIGCVVFEGLYRKLMHKPQSVGDLSAVVTGMLLAFVCPATTPLWMILIGDFFAIVVVKQLFGGIGKNFLNPALAGRAALLASYAGTMTSWLPAGTKAAIGGGMPVDVVSAATPLAYLKTGNMDGLKEIASVGDMFLGKIGGSMGEISALMLLIGGVYLLWRKVINWQTPVAYIATVAVLTLLFPKAGSGVEYMLYSIFGGGLFLGAFFMATDYATSPVTAKGQLIYGIGCGLFTVFIRYFGSYNEGVCYSIMVMNCCTALIDKYTKPVRFGVVKSEGGSREMSNEVKNKVDMDPKYIIKLTVTLFLTCMVVAGVLGWVNSITKDKIAAITWEKTVTAMKEVISADDFSDAMDLTDDMTAAATAQGGTLAAVYQAQSGGQPIGYAINVESSGSQGTISMMVGIDMDGAVTGVSIVTNSETSGIGSKVMGNEPLTNGTGVLDQFIGKSAADGTLSVGSNVDAITGATVSTKGVTTGVNAALAVAGVIG